MVTFNERSIEFYQQLTNRRKSWSVIQPSANQQVLEGAQATLSKALALSQLELPVGDWIQSEISQNQNIPTIVKTLLELNALDEIKHDLVLNNLKAVSEINPLNEVEVSSIVARANDLANAYSPIIVAGVLESSVFFVILPMFRFLGSPAFRTVASDISNDEQIHVATNLQFARDMGYNRGKALNNLRQDIISWLVSDLSSDASYKYLNKNFWEQTSDSLYYNGTAKDLHETKRAVMPAFFEINNSNLPIYN